MELIDRDAINEKCRNTKVDAVIPEWETLSKIAKQSVIKIARWYKTTLNTAPAVYIAPEQFGLWIPVTERLPDRVGRYLCVKRVGKSGAVYVQIMNGDSYGFSMEHIYTDDVTHWMPLPELPKEV